MTGGAGFLGSNLVRGLAEIQREVRVLDDLSNGFLSNLEGLGITFERGDICDTPALESIARGVDCVFHLAGMASVPKSFEDPAECFRRNVIGTAEVLRVCRTLDIPTVVFASSGAVYGNAHGVPVDESHPTLPISPYGVSKLAAEHLGRVLAADQGLRFVSARIFNAYGPRQRQFVMYELLRRLKENPNELMVQGTGKELRQFIYVDDLVDALLRIAERGTEPTYNVAGPDVISIADLARKLRDLVASRAEIRFKGASWSGDIAQMVADTKRLQRLDFRCRYSLDDGLLNLVRWMETTRA